MASWVTRTRNKRRQPPVSLTRYGGRRHIGQVPLVCTSKAFRLQNMRKPEREKVSVVRDQAPLRADARRNRDRILKVAVQHFATRGIDTSLEEIAKAAQVGSGTLYRHFPTREALLAAALRSSQDKLLSGAETARQLPHPGKALQTWLQYLQGYLRTFNGLPAPVLVAIKEQASPLAVSCQQLISTTEEFLAQAQQAGQASDRVTASDLVLGALATAWIADHVDALGSSIEALDALLAYGYLERGGDPRRQSG